MGGGVWCGLRLQRSAGLIQSREAAHDAMTGGEKKKLENPLEKEIRMEKPRGEKKQQRRTRRKTSLFFFPFFSRALLRTRRRDGEERELEK